MAKIKALPTPAARMDEDEDDEPDCPRCPPVGAPATRALDHAGYTELRQLAGLPATELGALHGVGPRALRIIEQALDEHGLALG